MPPSLRETRLRLVVTVFDTDRLAKPVFGAGPSVGRKMAPGWRSLKSMSCRDHHAHPRQARRSPPVGTATTCAVGAPASTPSAVRGPAAPQSAVRGPASTQSAVGAPAATPTSWVFGALLVLAQVDAGPRTAFLVLAHERNGGRQSGLPVQRARCRVAGVWASSQADITNTS